jgi:hypothetical protein
MIMHQDEINKDLKHYIHEKKDKPFWNRFKHRDQVKEELKEDVEKKAEEEEAKIPPEDKKDLEQMEEKIEQEHEAEEHIEIERQGVLKKFFKKLNFSGKKNDLEDEDPEDELQEEHKEHHVVVEDDEELKEFLKMNHTWITQLEPETLKEFKHSKDFELYTKMLKKYNLIK